MDSCACNAGGSASYRVKETIRTGYDRWRDELLNRSLNSNNCLLLQPNSTLLAISLLEFLNATYVAAHIRDTLRMLEPGSLLVVHLNKAARYRTGAKAADGSDMDGKPWHAELQWLRRHPAVRLNPTRIYVERLKGSILAAHLLNVKHITEHAHKHNTAVPTHIMLMASNMWLMRPGIETFVRCHTSSVRFGLATRACVPDYTCPLHDAVANATAMRRSTLCRLTVLRESFAFPIVQGGLLQKCAPEGQVTQ